MTAAMWYPGDRVIVGLVGTGTVVEASSTTPSLVVEMDDPDSWHPRADGRDDVVTVAERNVTRISEPLGEGSE